MSRKHIDVHLDELILDGLSGYSVDRIRSEVEHAIRKKLSLSHATVLKNSLPQRQSIELQLPYGLDSNRIGAHIFEHLHTVL
jgi:hypothetical protein